MTLVRITAASSYPVSLIEGKAHCRVDTADHDTIISGFIAAATYRAQRYTGQAYGAQTWEWVLSEFPDGEIEIPIGPIASVTSVKYYDVDGVERTISASDYQVDTVSANGRVIPDTSWPTAGTTVNAVRVRFVVGDAAPLDVKVAILLMVGHWFEYREEASGDSLKSIPLGVSALLDMHRRMYV